MSGKFDTSYLVIVSDSIFYGSEYNDNDVHKSLENLLRRKDSQSERNFIELFKYPFLNLKSNNRIVYNDNDDGVTDSQITEKISPTSYKISTKNHNEEAEYFLDYNKGLFEINYEWERIKYYKISLMKEKNTH